MQIPNSNRIYIIDSNNIVINVLIFMLIENEEINLKITWPAVIFAASRNLNVKGRTIILVLSIKIKNGLNHDGDLSGRRWAIVFFIE